MKANAVGKRCTEVEWAYIAGFLDADGAIMATIEPHAEKKHKFRIRVSLKVTQHDRDVLDWIRRKINLGIVRANRPGTHLQTFDLHVRDRQHVRAVLQTVRPYLRAKKRQAKIALRILENQINTLKETLRCAHLADSLARLNVRSKNRRKNFAARVKAHFSPND